MTKLEEEIKLAIESSESIPVYDVFGVEQSRVYDRDKEAKAAAEVAKKYIEKAWHDGYYTPKWTVNGMTYVYWLKENGVIE